MEDITALTTFQEQSGKRKMNERQPLLFQQQSIDSESDRKYENSNVRNSPNNSVLDVQNEDSLGEPLENISKFEYNLSTHRVLDHPTSNMDTMIHLLKGNIGTGILAMPDAFKNAGLYVGLFGTLFMGAICTHCMHILVNCSHELCCRLKLPALSFSEVAYGSFETGPTTLRRYSSVARKTVTSFLFITQIGFCCVYFLFVALNVQEVVAHYYIKVDVRIYLISMLVPMIFINLVRNLKYLTPISLFAAVLTVTGLAITFFYMLHDLPHTSTVTPVATWSSLPLYFGTAIYAFEGIGVILPLENNMKTPEDFRGLTGVLNTGMVIVACLYTSVGFFGYLKYGDNVQGSITLNLPPDEILSQMVRIAMAVAIFFSYTLQFYVPVNLIEPHVRAYFDTEQAKQLSTTLVRVVLVTITFILAACIPNLGPIISLVGAVSSSTLALIAPPIIEIATFWYIGYGRYNWVFWKDVAILTFGICGFLFGTYASILQIINSN